MSTEKLARLELLVTERLLSKSELGPLVLYNYTDSATYSRSWTPDVIASRGTIYNRESGKVVAKAFPKFFNLAMASACGFPVCSTGPTSFEEIVALKATIPFNQEGWVVRFNNGLRVKVKGDDYLRIAKIKSCLSLLSIWEAMMAGKIDEYLMAIPEEMRGDAEALRDTISSELDKIKAEVTPIVESLGLSGIDVKDKDAVKQAALAIRGCPQKLHGYLFNLLRTGLSDETILLKHLRPTGNVAVGASSV